MLDHFLTVTWTFDPTFIRIGDLDIRWYGVMWALAIALGEIFFIKFCNIFFNVIYIFIKIFNIK